MTHSIWVFITQQDNISHICDVLCEAVVEPLRLLIGRDTAVTYQEALTFCPKLQQTKQHREKYLDVPGNYGCIAVDGAGKLLVDIGTTGNLYKRVGDHSRHIISARRGKVASEILRFHQTLAAQSDWHTQWRVLCRFAPDVFYMWRYYAEIVLQIGFNSVEISPTLNLPINMQNFITHVQEQHQWLTRPASFTGGNCELPLSQTIASPGNQVRICAQCGSERPAGAWCFAHDPDLPPEAVICGNCYACRRTGRPRDADKQARLEDTRRLVAIPLADRVCHHHPEHNADTVKPGSWSFGSGYMECHSCYSRRLKLRVDTIIGKACVDYGSTKSRQFYCGSPAATYLCHPCFFKVPGRFIPLLRPRIPCRSSPSLR